MKVALTIAGSDSGGGAGIQADIKAIHANGVYAASVITSVTAQNTVEVREAFDLPTTVVRAQLEAVFDDIDIAAAKTGMLSSNAIIEEVAGFLNERDFAKLVVDPVMVSKSGFRLIQPDTGVSLCAKLLPLARVITPNLIEARELAVMEITSPHHMREAAKRIAAMGPRAVLIKGGHADFAFATDLLYDGESFTEFKPEGEVRKVDIHGSGCTFSAAIAARLALGESLHDAVANAKRYITAVIRGALQIGGGHPVGNHFPDR